MNTPIDGMLSGSIVAGGLDRPATKMNVLPYLWVDPLAGTLVPFAAAPAAGATSYPAVDPQAGTAAAATVAPAPAMARHAPGGSP